MIPEATASMVIRTQKHTCAVLVCAESALQMSQYAFAEALTICRDKSLTLNRRVEEINGMHLVPLLVIASALMK